MCSLLHGQREIPKFRRCRFLCHLAEMELEKRVLGNREHPATAPPPTSLPVRRPIFVSCPLASWHRLKTPLDPESAATTNEPYGHVGDPIHRYHRTHRATRISLQFPRCQGPSTFQAEGRQCRRLLRLLQSDGCP